MEYGYLVIYQLLDTLHGSTNNEHKRDFVINTRTTQASKW